jgi:hypothetical protein
MYFIEDAVTVAEVAQAMGRSRAAVDTICREAGFVIGHDWADRPSLTTREAWHVASGQAERRSENEALNISRQLAAEQWTAQRNAAYKVAYDAVFEANQRVPLAGRRSDGDVLPEAQRAGRDAVAEFEAKNPHPDRLPQSRLSRLLGVGR